MFRPDLMLWSAGLNVIYFAAAVAIFLRVLESARVAGSLLSTGE